ncbi:MAG TPA: phosphoenolpyruvate synthase [Flavisolibacter sp.]|jgi:pyruvate,water dikinase|nr:phosphoenolpyruvate synthase [Flavisolibacter sp.]
MPAFTKKFSDIHLSDLSEVGGKNASLGEMYSTLYEKGILIPNGFATTAFAFRMFLAENHLPQRLVPLLAQLDRSRYTNLKAIGSQARALILGATLPDRLATAILQAYRNLTEGDTKSVAVRSSATAEDLPEASFAGQHESFLNIQGDDAVLQAVLRCYASLYTDRAIKYREDHGFAHEKVALSAGIQKMVRSDKACSGVAFTLEPESGFRDIIHISGVWGLGENLVQGTVTPDEYLVFKPMLLKGKNGIIQKKTGDKAKTMVYAPLGSQVPVLNLETPVEKRDQFVLSDPEIMQLARWCQVIEDHYKKPMDIEWAKDGIDGQLYIVQARPETVQSSRSKTVQATYKLLKKGTPLTKGLAVGSQIASGKARLLRSPQDAGQLQNGEIVVTELTSPDWDPILKRAAAIVTNKGGRTSHASIVARELGVPALVGCDSATEMIRDGQEITVCCHEGKTGIVYDSLLPFEVAEIDFSTISLPEQTKVLLITGDPDQAFSLSYYPSHGVGLMRMEFIITHSVQVHPMALVHFKQLKDPTVKEQIELLTHHYPDKKNYFIEKLSQGIATLAAAFYPREVIVRLSDFKTNEYANLIGGKAFEPQEENPMIGFRGASRYDHDLYREGFALECAALYMVRNEMGLDNVKIMVPFCRTPDEAKRVLSLMAKYGLDRETDNTLDIYVMAEIPSNVLLAEKFATLFDGFSIGSNDLTQLTLGIDRDSSIISDQFSEQDEAVRSIIGLMIEKAVRLGKPIGLCGQAPSDDPQFARFLVGKGINSISFTPDALFQGIENILSAEKSKVPEESEILTF